MRGEESPNVMGSLRLDADVMNEVFGLLSRAEHRSGVGLESAGGTSLESLFADAGVHATGTHLDVMRGDSDSGLFRSPLPTDRVQLEAIVQLTGRPALLVQNDDWESPVIESLEKRLSEARERLKPCLPAVGRIDVGSGGGKSRMLGTGWLVEPTLLVTNRHVAEAFVRATRSGEQVVYSLPAEGATFDTVQEFQIDRARSVKITGVRHIETRNRLHDIAVLQVDSPDVITATLELDVGEIEFGVDIAAIGYPAYDPRNDTFAMLNYFRDIYEVKRLSPGKVIGAADEDRIEHDCTTLGGSSGSALIDLASGKLIGLHFAGSYKDRNYGLKAARIRQYL